MKRVSGGAWRGLLVAWTLAPAIFAPPAGASPPVVDTISASEHSATMTFHAGAGEPAQSAPGHYDVLLGSAVICSFPEPDGNGGPYPEARTYTCQADGLPGCATLSWHPQYSDVSGMVFPGEGRTFTTTGCPTQEPAPPPPAPPSWCDPVFDLFLFAPPLDIPIFNFTRDGMSYWNSNGYNFYGGVATPAEWGIVLPGTDIVPVDYFGPGISYGGGQALHVGHQMGPYPELVASEGQVPAWQVIADWTDRVGLEPPAVLQEFAGTTDLWQTREGWQPNGTAPGPVAPHLPGLRCYSVRLEAPLLDITEGVEGGLCIWIRPDRFYDLWWAMDTPEAMRNRADWTQGEMPPDALSVSFHGLPAFAQWNPGKRCIVLRPAVGDAAEYHFGYDAAIRDSANETMRFRSPEFRLVVQPAPPQASALDRDGDGVADATDDCPEAANPDQRDLDGDGTGDECDPDADGDHAIDAGFGFLDDCPGVPNPDQLDTDGDGAGDACDAVAVAPHTDLAEAQDKTRSPAPAPAASPWYWLLLPVAVAGVAAMAILRRRRRLR